MEKGLRWVGVAGIAIGLLMALAGVGEQDMLLVTGGIAFAVSGLLFVGFAQVIELLIDIRAALVPPKATATEADTGPVDHPTGWAPRTPEEMKFAIAQARAKLDVKGL